MLWVLRFGPWSGSSRSLLGTPNVTSPGWTTVIWKREGWRGFTDPGMSARGLLA